MRQETRHDIDLLLKRVEEVRSLLSLPPKNYSWIDEEELPVRLCSELLESLEATHRRLIETSTKLSVLREMVEGILSAVRPEEAMQTVCSYMHRVLGMEEVGLWVMNRETGNLEGRWSSLEPQGLDTHEHSFALTDVEGKLKSALWHMQTALFAAEELTAQLGLPLSTEETALTVIPLASSRQWLPCKEVKKCIRHECRAYFATSRFCWETPSTLCFHEKGFDMSRRDEFCLRCEVFPLLGLLAVRKGSPQELSPSELAMVESIAYNVSRILESSRLYGDLRVGQEFRESILDSMGECLVALDLAGRIVAFNRMSEAVTGFSADEVMGTEFGFLVPSEQQKQSPIAKALRRGLELSSADTLVSRRSGGTVPVRMTTRLLRDEKDYVKGVIVTFTDQRPARRAEEKMKQLDRLAALGRFASSVAHELRNPLSGIAAGIQYMSRQLGDTEPEVENVRFLLREVARLERIIQDLLRITHPQQLILTEAHIEDVVERALKCLGPDITAKGIHLDFSIAGEIPTITMDIDQMQQVFINLIRNALEAAGDEGSISIEVTAGEDIDYEHSSGITVTISDSGAGIERVNLGRVFEPFFTTKPGGTGLGLYITHDIVRRHGGEIVVASEVGKGASFSVRLPIAGTLDQGGA